MKRIQISVIILLIMNAVCLLLLLFINISENRKHELREIELISSKEEIEYERNTLSDIIRNKLDCEAVGDTTSMEKLCTDYLDNWGNTGDWKLILGNWSYSYPTGPVE